MYIVIPYPLVRIPSLVKQVIPRAPAWFVTTCTFSIPASALICHATRFCLCVSPTMILAVAYQDHSGDLSKQAMDRCLPPLLCSSGNFNIDVVSIHCISPAQRPLTGSTHVLHLRWLCKVHGSSPITCARPTQKLGRLPSCMQRPCTSVQHAVLPAKGLVRNSLGASYTLLGTTTRLCCPGTTLPRRSLSRDHLRHGASPNTHTHPPLFPDTCCESR